MGPRLPQRQPQRSAGILWALAIAKQIGLLSMANYFRMNKYERVFLFETPERTPWEDRLKMHKTALEIVLGAQTE